MHIFEKKEDISRFLEPLKSQGKLIGFVPTMGALHEGHISLIAKSSKENHITVCSIFVNPTQFNNKNDLDNYPRTLDSDLAKLKGANCSVVFIPSTEEIYSAGDESFKLDFGKLDKVMEGKFRPGHFQGMAMVVDKLFTIVSPHSAYFGEKDFQQLALVSELAKRKHPSVKVVACATVREPDGLAMSSRNALLSAEERKAAVILSKTLFEAQKKAGKIPVDLLNYQAMEILTSVELVKPEYFEIVDSITLQTVSDWNEGGGKRACLAAMVGKVRLIDNVEL